jgi:O-antigen/teichoic acid export membrane protein
MSCCFSRIYELKSCLDFCFLLIPGILGVWVLSQTDRIFIERYLSLKEVSIYSMRFGLAFTVTITGGLERAFRPIYFPLLKGISSPQIST